MQTQPSEMIARVAWAILDAGSGDSLNLDAARAAIEAMREPDGVMCEAGGEELAYRGMIASWHLAEMVWRAMIDAALSQASGA